MINTRNVDGMEFYMNEKQQFKKRETLYFSIACIVCNISFYPIFVRNGIGHTAVIAVWGILLVLVLSYSLFNCWTRELKRYALLCIFFVLNTFITGILNDVNAFGNHFFQPVLIASVIFLIATRAGIRIDINDLKKVCTVFFYSMAVIAVLLFVFYLRGTDFSTAVYGYKFGKNEIAVLLLCAFHISCTVYSPTRKWHHLFRIISILFFVLDIFLLRTRSAMLGIGLLGIVLVFHGKRFRRGVRCFLILSVLAVSVYFFLNIDKFNTLLYQIVYAGRDFRDWNDLTSGRGDEIAIALEAFRESPIVGVGKMGTCDCFFVSVLANYGLFCWPVVVMSLAPLIWSIKNIRLYSDMSICFFLIAGSIFFISFLEELAPFGSGTRCYLLWLMWGVLVQNKEKDRRLMMNEAGGK